MRLIVAFSLLFLSAFGGPSGEASEPRILTEARNLNRARYARITAEIALQETILSARQSLLDDGYAAPLEVDVSKTRLRELQALRFQIREHEAFLKQVAASGDIQEERTSRPRDQKMAIGLPMSIPFFHYHHPAWIVESTDELRSLSEQLASTRAESKGELQALAAEAAFLEALLIRLRTIDDGSIALQRERELTEKRLAIQRCRIEMGRAQQRYAACRELLHQEDNWVGFPIRLEDEQITHPRRLLTILESRWHFHRLESAREAVFARKHLRSKYRDQLVALEEANFGRPGEAWLWEYALGRSAQELALLDDRLSQLHRLGWGAASQGEQRGRHLLPVGFADLRGAAHNHFPITMGDDARIHAAIAAGRRRIARLAPVPAESVTARELERTKLELAVYEAEWRVLQEEQTLWSQFAQLMNSDAWKTREVSSVVGIADRSALGSQRLGTWLISWFRARTENKGKQDLAKSRIELLEWKLAGLQPLRKLGYATWKEVAAAERDLEQARAHALAAWEERRIAEMEHQRVLAAIGGDSSESQVAVLVR